MKTVQVDKAGGDFGIAERPVPEPGPGVVRVKEAACGICHSDAFVKEGHWPKLQYPRVPGHEVAGTVDAVGPGVDEWAAGDRVGIGWHGGHCGHCDTRAGDLVAVHGIGGLGHLGIQFARQTGFQVAAILRGRDKENRRCGWGSMGWARVISNPDRDDDIEPRPPPFPKRPMLGA